MSQTVCGRVGGGSCFDDKTTASVLGKKGFGRPPLEAVAVAVGMLQNDEIPTKGPVVAFNALQVQSICKQSALEQIPNPLYVRLHVMASLRPAPGSPGQSGV